MATMMVGTQEVQKIMYGTEELTTLAIGEWSFPVGGDDYSKMPFTIEALTSGDLVFKRNGYSSYEKSFWYTINDEEPVSVTIKRNTLTIPLNVGDKVSWAVDTQNNGMTDDAGKMYNFSNSTLNYKVYGNILSLLYPDFESATTLPSSGCFQNFFSNDGHIVDAENLVLQGETTENCYASMFAGALNLTKAPKALPSTTAVTGCYSRMFSGCTSLTKGPDIMAVEAGEQAYSNMFNGCTALTGVTINTMDYTGIMTCYNMFTNCSGLTEAPYLPATGLTESCYQEMFYNCKGMTTPMSELPASTMAKNCYLTMFRGCSGLTSSPALPATVLAEGCYANMFRECSGLTSSPSLPAPILETTCYKMMFYNCTSLNHVSCLATDISAQDCTADWLFMSQMHGTFVKDANMSSWSTGTSGIPSFWTVENA